MSPLSRIHRLRARRLGRRAVASVALLAVASVVGIVGGLASLAAGDPVSIIVRFDAGTTVEQRDAAIAAVGGTVVDTIPVLRMEVVEVPEGEEYAAITTLRADDVVTSADLDRPREAQAAPNDPAYDAQWALDRIGWSDIYGSLELQGTSRLAVLDTGVDANDPDLADRVIPGWSAFEGQTAYFDPNGHGTALASIAASVTDNGEGIAGVAYGGVEILPVQVLDGTGVGQDGDIIEGLVWAVDHGADVALMGFSSTGYSSALQAAVEYAWANDVVVVAAVGNDGDDLSHFPAAMAKVVGVSATNQQDERWYGSNFGSSVFMAAPGTGIESVLGPITGTSPAAAIVAGAAALLQAVDPGAEPGVIVGRLARNADPVGSTDDLGNGILNLAAAVADGGTESVVPVGGSPVGDGGPYVTYSGAATCDGTGTFATGTTTAAAGTEIGTLSFTFTSACASPGFTSGAQLTVDVPTGWTTPQTGTSNGAGYITSSATGGSACSLGTKSLSSPTYSVGIVCTDATKTATVDYKKTTPAAWFSNVTFSPASAFVGETTTWTVSLTTTASRAGTPTSPATATAVNSTTPIVLVFPTGFTLPASGTPSLTGFGDTCSGSTFSSSGQAVTVALSGTCSLGASSTGSIAIPNVQNTSTAGSLATSSMTAGVRQEFVTKTKNNGGTLTAIAASPQIVVTNQASSAVSILSKALATISTPAALSEGAATPQITFTVTIPAQSLEVRIPYSTEDRTPAGSTYATGGASCATAGVDYQSTSGTLVFEAGATSKSFTVNICGDSNLEETESFYVRYSKGSPDRVRFDTGDTLASATATGTITDDDSGITFSVACQTSPCESQSEGTAFTTQIGTLAANEAKDATSLSLSLSAGASIPPSGATFYLKTGDEIQKVTSWTGTGPYTLTVERAQLGTSVPGGSGTTSAGTAVFVSGASASGGTYLLKITASGNVTGTAKYETVADPRPGQNTATIGAVGATCADGVDVVYAGATGTPVSLSPPTTTSQNFSVTICKDGAFERTETFAIKVYDAATAVVGASAAPSGANATYLYLTITNDELVPSLVVSDAVPTNEGDSGTTNLSFTVTRWGPSEVPTNGTFAVAGSGANAAAPADFVGGVFPSGAVAELGTSYNAYTTATITVAVQGDLAPEPGETFDVTYSLVLASVGTATLLDATGTGTIQNDDTRVVITGEGGPGQSESGGSYEFLVRVFNAHTNAPIGGSSGVSLSYTLSGVTSGATCTTSLDAKTQASTEPVDDYSSLYVVLCSNSTAQADRTATVTFTAINAVFSGVGANVKTFQIYDDDKTITAKVVRDSNLNGYEDTGDTALGGVGLRLFVDGVNAAGVGADTVFDPSSDFQVSVTTTSSTKSTLGIGTFSGLRNLTYFVVETDPTSLGPIASVGVTQGCGGISAATVPASMNSSVTPITVNEIVAPTVALPVIRCIDSEQVSLTTRTQISGSSYSYAIVRGANGTAAANHAAGSTLFRPFASAVDATGIYKNNVIRVAFDPASEAVSGATVANKFLDVLTQASIAGSVLLDGDANGTIERTETSVVEDAVVALFRDANGNSSFDPGVDSDTNPVTGAKFAANGPTDGLTDAYGAWSFTGLVGGTYFVVETDPTAGTICTDGVCQGTSTNFGSTGGAPTPAWAGLVEAKYPYNVLKVVLASGTTVSTGNNFFDSVATSTISGRNVNDVNANNLDDAEVGLAASVKLYRDSNYNGLFDGSGTDLEYGSSPTATTFSFGSLLKGTYFLIETDLEGYASTVAIPGSGANTSSVVPTEAWAQAITPINYLNNALKVTVSADGATSTENLFLDSIAGSFITVGVIDDRNANGLVDADETSRLAGATIRLYRDNPRTLPTGSYDATDFLVSTQTSTTALTSFEKLVLGTYFIQETNPTNFQSTGFSTDASIGGVVGSSTNDQIKVSVTVNGTTYGEHRFIDALAASTVSGAVTEDVNGDAIYDSAGPDRALRGAVVTLYRDNGDAAYGAGDAQVGAPQTTSLAGTFSFGSLTVGTYWVIETNPGGFTSTNALATGVGSNIESSPTNAVTAGADLDRIKVVIAPYTSSSSGGRTSAGNRFLDNSNYSIAGTVFNDANADLSSAGDAGKDGVVVTLYGADGTTVVGGPIFSASANPIGGFGFGNIRTGNALPPGEYFLEVTAPVSVSEHWKSTQALAGTGSSTWVSESRLKIVIGVTSATATSTSNEFLVTRDDYEISGSIIDDTDASRVVNGAEGTLASPAATFTLYRDANGNGTLEIGTDTTYSSATSSGGTFSLTGLTAGTYWVDESSLPSGYLATNAIPGLLVASGGGTSATQAYVSDTRLRVSIVANGNARAHHANNRFLVSDASRAVSGDVVNDADADGAVGISEGGLAGATVTLYRDNPSAGTAGVYDNLDILIGAAPVTTSAGTFLWTGLVTGRYFAIRANPAGPPAYVSTNSFAGTGTTAATESYDRIRIDLPTTKNASNSGNRFLAAPASYSISGVVYNDADGSGSVSLTSLGVPEAGKGSVYVTLTLTPNRGTWRVLADPTGVYTIPDLIAGTYQVTVAEGDLPVGWVRTPQPDVAPSRWSRTLTLAGGVNISEGLVSTIGTDPETAALYLRAKNASISGSLYGDLDGSTTYSKTAGDSLIAGATVVVFRDATPPGGTPNGVYDPGEEVGSATTTASGAFQITGLYADPNYLLTYLVPTNYVNVLGASKVLSVNLAASQAASGKNFFTQPQSVISGLASVDVNADSLRATSSPPLSGVTVQVWRESDGTVGKSASDTSIGTVTTGADGTFTFSGLNSQSKLSNGTNSTGIVYYLRQISAPATYSFTGMVKGTGTTVVTLPVTTQEIKVTFTTSGTTSANNYVLNTRDDDVTISGTVYEDLNANGVVDSFTTLQGATVAVFLDGGNGTYDAAGAGSDDTQIWASVNGAGRAASAPSLSDGTWSLGDLPTGTYFVVETDKSGYSSTSAERGTNTNAATDVLTSSVLKVVATAANATSTGNRFLDTANDSGTISGFVYEDRNADGVNGSSTKLADAVVQIYREYDGVTGKSDGDILLNAITSGTTRTNSVITTSGSSAFSFGGLPNGTFYVVETDPTSPRYTSTNALIGTGPQTTSTWISNNVVQVVLNTGASGRTNTNNIFLDTRNDEVTISGTFEDDRNGNGSWDALADTGLVGATVTVYRDGGDGTYSAGAGDDTQMYAVTSGTTRSASITLAAGSAAWSLGGLPTGTYWVRLVTPSANYVPTATFATDATSFTEPSATTKVLRFTSLAANATKTATTWRVALGNNSVSGLSYFDVNGNGNGDFTKTGKNTKSDSPLEGTLIYLYRDADGDGAYNPANDTLVSTNSAGTVITNPRTTPADGTYTFGSLLPGVYFVVQDPPTTADLDFVPTGADVPNTCAPTGTGWASGYTVCSEHPNLFPKRSPAPKDVYVRVAASGASQVALTNVYLLAQGGDLSVSLTDGVETVVAGGDLTYTATIRNVGGGNVPANSSTLSMELPTGVTLDSATTGCSLTAASGATLAKVSCLNDAVIPRDGSKAYTIKVHVAMDFAGTSLTMKARVDAPAFDFNETNNVTDTGYYDIIATVGTLATTFDNNDLSFQVTETIDPSPAPFDVIVDNEQVRVSGRSCTTTCVYVIPSSPNGRAQNGSSASAHNTLGVPVLKVSSIPADVNSVTKTSALAVDTVVYGGAGIWPGYTTDPGTVVAGTNLVYQVTASNTGPSSAAAKITTALRPSGTTADGVPYVEGEYCVATGTNAKARTDSCGLTGAGTGSWSSIPSSGGTAGVLFNAMLDGQTSTGGGGWRNGADLVIFVRVKVAPSADPGLAMKSSESATTTSAWATGFPASSGSQASVVTRANLSSVLTASTLEPAVAGGEHLYTLVVTNAGPSDARDVAAYEALDAAFSSAKACVGSGCAKSGATTWTGASRSIGTIAALSTGTVRIWAALPSNVAKNTSLSSSVLGYSASTLDYSPDILTDTNFTAALTPMAIAGGADSIPDNNIGTAASSSILIADLSVTLAFVTPASERIYGEPIVYSMTVTNGGPSDAPLVAASSQVADLYSVSISVAGRDATCETNGVFPCALGTMTAGATVSVTVTALPKPSVAGLTPNADPSISNTASVLSTDSDYNSGSFSDPGSETSSALTSSIKRRPTTVADMAAPADGFFDSTVTVSADLLDDLEAVAVGAGALATPVYQPVIDGNAHDVSFRSACGTGATYIASTTTTTVTTTSGTATASVKLDARAGNDCYVEVWFPGMTGTIHGKMTAPLKKPILVTKREVTIAYAGNEFIQMSSATTSSTSPIEVNIMPSSGLAGSTAPVVDITATAYDANGIQMMSTIGGRATITEIWSAGQRVGWKATGPTISATQSGQTYDIHVSLENDPNYKRVGDGVEQFFVTYFYPTSETYVAGGGWIRDPSPDPAGNPLLITRNDKVTWAFNVKYRKGSTTPQGSFVLVIRADNGRTYKVRNTSWNNGLLTFPTKSQSTFKGNGVVQVTDTLTGATILDDYYSGRPVVFRIDVSSTLTTGKRISIWVYREAGGKWLETFYKAGGGTVQVNNMITLGGGGMLIKP